MVNKRTRGFAAAKLSLSVAAALAAMASMPASAFNIETDNPDATLSLDTTVRYSLGWRMEDIDPRLAGHYGNDETETRFKKYDVVTNRLDVFTEMDYTLKRGNNKYGARASAALWSENAYPKTLHTDYIDSRMPAASPWSNYGSGRQYSSYAKRYITGTSGEFLDAFVFGGFELGTSMLDVKLGAHNVYWGESMFSPADSIAHMQGPMDLFKGQATPGAEVKELFMPVNQLSANWTVSDQLSFMGYYQFDWKPNRVASGGTFFGSGDSSGSGLGNDVQCSSIVWIGSSLCIRSADAITPGRSGGDYGLAVRMAPQWLNGTAGLYYRKYDEKLPWGTLQSALDGTIGVRLVYPRNTELFGLSYMTRFGEVSTGIEASYRRNTALNSTAAIASTTLATLANTPSYEEMEAARGNTFHFLINGMSMLRKNAFWETGTVIGELTYQRLDKVTKNAHRYNAVGYACANGQSKDQGCSTRESWWARVSFTPQWMGVLPSTDLSMPMSYSQAIKGNSPINALGSFEGKVSWNIGLEAVYKTLYKFNLDLYDTYQRFDTQPGTGLRGLAGTTLWSTSNGPGTAPSNNKRWLSFRFKTTF